MKKLFRKAITVLGSVALVGATIGGAAAAAYPAPFNSGSYAVVYGAGSQDSAAATTIAGGLPSLTGGITTLSGAVGVTEDEVVLGGVINASGYKVQTTMTDTKISSLLDEKISWDDGNGADDYDIHEEIVINGDMTVLTSLDDEDLTGVALSNNMALEYRYVFDDALNTTDIDAVGADDLYLTILGKSYQITDITTSTVTVTTSEEMSVRIGESVTVGGKTFTLDDLSSSSARINGEVLTIDGSSKKINGFQVEASDVFYNDNFPETASVTLKIGEDISKVYSDGDEYIGQDENDPLWTWTISDPTTDGGYIGVEYNVNINDADDEEAGDTIKYVGAGYILPENFAEVKLDGLTIVDYEDVTVKFTEKDLYNMSNTTSSIESANVIVISAETTSSITVGTEETDEIYIYYAKEGSETDAPAVNGTIEVFYRDHDGDDTPTNRARFEIDYDLNGTNDLSRTNIATIEVGDTIIDIDITIVGGAATLHFENPDNNDIDLNIDGVAIGQAAGDFTQLGTTAEDADALDIKVGGNDVSTKDESIMDYYGIIVAKDDSGGVEGNADSDEITLSIPSDQVYAIVSVNAGGTASTSETGVATFMDNQASSFAGKNIVVVGGSCINSVAATLLGSAYCGDDFTGATAVGPGKFLIQSFDYNGKIATLVAGYEKDDTAKAATYLANTANAVSTTAGSKIIVQTATETVLSTV